MIDSGVNEYMFTSYYDVNMYSFTPESSEVCKGKVPYPRTQHRNNILILSGEK